MKIQVFAVLKEHFDKEFDLSDNIADVAALREHLSALNSDATGILKLCRFAVHNEFVNNDHTLTTNDTICIFPPSSGG